MSLIKFLFDNTKDHYQGSVFAPIELIMYGDFQCIHSAQVYPDIKLLIETMGSRMDTTILKDCTKPVAIRTIYMIFHLKRIV